MTKLAWLFVAGGFGTLARYGLSGLVHWIYGGELPIGTFAVNFFGCFVFGIVWILSEDRLMISGEARFLILTGFTGAFTTFSTYAFEASALLRDSEWLFAAANILAQNGLGIAAVMLGLAAGRLL